MEVDSLVRFTVVALIAGGMFLGWLLLLAGVSAVQQSCDVRCREVTGLTWWIVWFQLLAYLAAVPIQLGKFLSAQYAIITILAILAALEMVEADRLLDLKSVIGHSSRVNATVAGHSVLAAFNVLLILFIGFIPYEDDEVGGPYASNPDHKRHVPADPAIAGGHPMKPMTSRASSMRAASPPASEASYPAVPPGRGI